jgi:hypothetical protein
MGSVLKISENSEYIEKYIRIATLNLDHSEDSKEVRLISAQKSIKDIKSDITCLQEVSLYNGISTAVILANSLDMNISVISPNGNAIISRYPITKSWVFDLGSTTFGSCDAVLAIINSGCHQYLVVSTHLSWGSGLENERLLQSLDIDEHISHLAPHEPLRSTSEPIFGVLCGDLNAEPDSDTIRWLTGLAVVEGRSTLWVDAWKNSLGEGKTSTPDNMWAGRTASSVGISHPHLLPSRRIDYILARGFAYGRIGAPVNTWIFGNAADNNLIPSDHFGVATDLMC